MFHEPARLLIASSAFLPGPLSGEDRRQEAAERPGVVKAGDCGAGKAARAVRLLPPGSPRRVAEQRPGIGEMMSLSEIYFLLFCSSPRPG